MFAAALALATTLAGCALFEPIYDVPPSGDAATDGSLAESGTGATGGDDASDGSISPDSGVDAFSDATAGEVSDATDTALVDATDAEASDDADALAAIDSASADSSGDADSGAASDAASASDSTSATDAHTGSDSSSATDSAADTSDACASAPTCVGAQRMKCGAVLETCVSSALCTPTACLAPVCVAGATTCADSKTLQTCDSSRAKWNSTSCTIGCSAGACLAATQVAVGSEHACALLSDGSLRCWGANSVGQLGDGTTADQYSPTKVPGITDARFVAAVSADVGVDGKTSTTCFARSTGVVWCMGVDLTQSSHAPLLVPTATNLVGASEVALLWSNRSNNYGSVCSQSSSGAISCVGASTGTGGTPTSWYSTPVARGTTTGHIACSNDSCRAPTATGYCTWADLTGASCASGLTNVIKEFHSLDGGGLYLYGDGSLTVDSCYLDTASGNDVCAPKPTGLSKCTLVAFQDQDPGFTNPGTGFAVCNGLAYQVGLRSADSSGNPVLTRLAAIDGATALDADHENSQLACAVVAGDVLCWGNLNDHGQLGDGTTFTRTSPVHVKW